MQQIYPDEHGRYGDYGGKYVPETLMYALEELEEAFNAAWEDESFHEEYQDILREYAGRETPLTFAGRRPAATAEAQAVPLLLEKKLTLWASLILLVKKNTKEFDH